MRINTNQPMFPNTANSLNSTPKQSFANPFLSNNYKDSYNFSPIAGKLRIEGKSASLWDGKITKSSDDKTLQIMENQINVVGRILEQQKNLTELAKDESLNDLDRIDLQIEMEELQKQLTVETRRMSMMMAGMSQSEIQNELAYFMSSSSSDGLLQRARERMINGKEWDVAETFQIGMELKEVRIITDSSSLVISTDNGEYDLPPDIDLSKSVVGKLQNWVGGDIVATNNESLPTVREKLQLLNAISLMDSSSAAKGSEQIDKQIENLAQMKQEFLAFYEEYGGNPIAEQNIESGNMTEQYQTEQMRSVAHATLGKMVFSSIKSNGSVDLSDPRLQEASTPIGSMFSKIEKLFKDKIERSLGYRNPFDGNLINKMYAVGPAK
jgi:hypothetical protein